MALFHYYGDIERRLFVVGGIAMLVTLPLFNHLLPVPVLYSLLAVLVLVLVAGLVSPRQKWGALANTAIAAAATAVFGYYAILIGNSEHQDIHQVLLFWTDLALAVNFLLALYYSVKTLRGAFSKRELL